MLKKILIGIGIIAVLFTVYYLQKPKYGKKPKVEVKSMALESISESINVSGTVEVQKEIIINPNLDGFVYDVLKKDGDNVSKGEVILIIKNSNAVSNLIQDRISTKLEYNSALSDFCSKKALYTTKGISKTAYNQALDRLKKSDVALNAVDGKFELLKEQGIDLEPLVASFKDRVEVKAPIDGKIIALNCKKADFLRGGEPIAIVADMKSIVAKVYCDEIDVEKIIHGQEATISIEALGNKKFNGNITQIGTLAKSIENIASIEVLIKFNEFDEAIRPGMTVDARIIVNKKQNVFTVPIVALYVEENEMVTNKSYTKKKDIFKARESYYVLGIEVKNETFKEFEVGKVKKFEVEIGIIGEDNVEVTSGVNTADLIITYSDKLIAPSDIILYKTGEFMKEDNLPREERTEERTTEEDEGKQESD